MALLTEAELYRILVAIEGACDIMGLEFRF